jgi:hypothetical protein
MKDDRVSGVQVHLLYLITEPVFVNVKNREMTFLLEAAHALKQALGEGTGK